MLDQLDTVKLNDTHKELSQAELQTAAYQTLQSIQTLQNLQVNVVPATSLSVDSPVRTLALQAAVRAWKESEVDFSTRLSGSQKKYVRRLCSLKTSQQLELVDFERSSEHLPIWGMTVGGRVFLPKALELLTNERGGSCLPTPTASRYGRNKSKNSDKQRPSLETMWRRGTLPTPTVSQKSYDRQKNGSKTLSVSGAWKATTGTTMPASFLEWIMGIPFGHTELNPWVMEWFLNKRKKHLKR